jgi:hypothetical protein
MAKPVGAGGAADTRASGGSVERDQAAETQAS